MRWSLCDYEKKREHVLGMVRDLHLLTFTIYYILVYIPLTNIYVSLRVSWMCMISGHPAVPTWAINCFVLWRNEYNRNNELGTSLVILVFYLFLFTITVQFMSLSLVAGQVCSEVKGGVQGEAAEVDTEVASNQYSMEAMGYSSSFYTWFQTLLGWHDTTSQHDVRDQISKKTRENVCLLSNKSDRYENSRLLRCTLR